MAIGPISGISAPLGAANIAASTAVAKPAEAGQGGGFGNVLKNAVDNINDTQQQAAQSVSDLLSGRENDVLPAVTAMAKADLSFKLLLGVRNKVIDAYKQTMNMQI
jgi:flagellar hook-basal body complex protein FliE